MSTHQEFIAEAAKRDIDHQLIWVGGEKGTPVVNLMSGWTRVPDATVAWPRRDAEDETVAWGHAWEHRAPLDTPAADLLDRVLATLPKEG